MNITNKVIEKSTIKNLNRVKAAVKLGLLQIVMVEDPDYDFDNLCGDTYNPTVNPDIAPEQLERELEEFRNRVNDGGVFGALLQCRAFAGDEFQTIESIWGFVGQDFIGSGYENDFVSIADDWFASGINWQEMDTLIKNLFG